MKKTKFSSLLRRVRMIGLFVILLAAGLFFQTGTVKAEVCTWSTSTPGANISDASSWADCTLSSDDTLLFGATTTAATWDSGLIQIAGVSTTPEYTGTITLGTNVSSTGDVFIGSATTFDLGAYSLDVAGDFLNYGNVSQSAGYTGMSGNSNLGGSGRTQLFAFLVNNSNTVTFSGDVVASSTITIGSGSTLILGANGLQFGGALSNSGSITQTASSTFMTGDANIGGSGRTQLFAFTVSHSDGVDATLVGDLVVSSTLTIGSDVNLALGANGLQFGGALANSGSITQTASSTLMTGDANIGGSGRTQLFAFTISASNGVDATLVGDLIVSSTLTIGSDVNLAMEAYGLEAGGAITNSGAITQTASSTIMTGSANLGGSGRTQFFAFTADNSNTVTFAGDVVASSTITIGSGSALTMGAYGLQFGGALSNSGTITQTASSTIMTGSANLGGSGSSSFFNLTLNETVTLTGSVTSTNAFTNSGALTISDSVNLVASGTFNNDGTITETGAIIHALTSSKFTDTSGTEVTSYNTGSDTLFITVEDHDGNLDATALDTITGSVYTANDGVVDQESMTLTETGVDTGVFRSSIGFTPSAQKTQNNGKIEVNGAGSLALTFTDSKDSTDTGTDTANYTGSSVGSGGSPVSNPVTESTTDDTATETNTTDTTTDDSTADTTTDDTATDEEIVDDVITDDATEEVVDPEEKEAESDQEESAPEAISETSSCPLLTGQPYKTLDSNTVYYITENCTKSVFRSAEKFFSYFTSWDVVKNASHKNLREISTDQLGFMPWGPLYDPQFGALVKIAKDPKVYLLLGNEKYWITSEEVFNALYDGRWNWIETIDKSLLDKYATGSEINYQDHHPNYSLIKYQNSNKIYRLEPDPNDSTKQVKRHIIDEKTFVSLGFRWDRIVDIADSEIYADGKTITLDAGAE